MIIGITGYKFSGKDTVADFICHMFPSYKKIAFATPIKVALNAVFGWGDDNWTEENKEKIDSYWGISPRQAAQNVGTEWGREMLPQTFPLFNEKTGKDIWIKSAMRHADRDIVISDVRFVNEAMAIHAKGGIVLRLNRFNQSSDIHPSEQEVQKIQADFDIDNFGDMEDTLRSVRSIVSLYS